MNEQETKLQDEIFAEARAKAERVVARAKNDADGILASGRRAAQERHEARLKEVGDLADSQCKSMLIGIDMEINRRWLKRQEACIDALLAEALADAEALQGAEREAMMGQLTREAFQAMGNVPCQAVVSAQDRGLVTAQWIQEQLRGIFPDGVAAIDVVADDTVKGGIVLKASDGSRTFDNSLKTRLVRLHDELRLLTL